MPGSLPRDGSNLRPRITFATRLLLGGFALSLVIITAVSAFLLISRDKQVRGGAQTNADSRAQAYRQLLQRVTAPQARGAAKSVAGLQRIALALQDPDPSTAVAKLISGPTSAVTQLPDDSLVVFDANGRVLASTQPSEAPPLTGSLASVRSALAGSPAEAIEFPDGKQALWDFAAPVMAPGSSSVLGVVVYSAPLESQMLRLLPAVGQGYTAVLLRNAPGASLVRLTGDPAHPTATTAALPPELGAQPGGSADSFGGFYTTPQGEVAAAFEGISTNQGPPAVYIGVETPVSAFVGDQRTDVLTVLWLALSAILLTWFGVLLFVNRFVRRPVAQLSEGVTRIAGGDYRSDIQVTSHDELGVLAVQVNRMRAQIESYIRHIDAAVTRLGDVSRALTTTTAGVGSLEIAVCSAAVGMAGTGAAAYMLDREDDGSLRVSAASRNAPPPPELDRETLATVVSGSPARFEHRGNPALIVPMFYQQEVRGAIVVSGPQPVTDADARALTALANNAAIALENTRLFEQERETVRRLRELDAMKSDFLATAQHELRTPLTAIMGQLELMRMMWPSSDDAQKLGIIDDIEISTNQLAEMLETIIDLSLVSAANLRMRRLQVDLGSEVRESIDEIMRRFREGLPVNLEVDVPNGLSVDADPERLRQVIRCLVDNAVKFTDPGGTVRVSARPTDSGRRCLIEVSDTGIGIDQANQQRIFERFFQVDNTGTRAYGGMGVGLALVKVLAEAHGATVRVESSPGRGSRFLVDWPGYHDSTVIDAVTSGDDGEQVGHVSESNEPASPAVTKV